MAKDFYSLGDIAARGATMLEIAAGGAAQPVLPACTPSPAPASEAHEGSLWPTRNSPAYLKEGSKAWNAWREEAGKGVQIDLCGANLSKGGPRRCEPQRSDSLRANLREARMGSFKDGVDLGVDLRDANLSGVVLQRPRLGTTDFSGANLTEARLGGDFSGTNLDRANLDGAELSRAELGRAVIGTRPRGKEIPGRATRRSGKTSGHFQNSADLRGFPASQAARGAHRPGWHWRRV